MIPASRIRVLIADLPDSFVHMLASKIVAQPDMMLVRQVEGAVQLLVAANEGVDVVILGTPQLRPVPGIISHLLNAFPFVKVLLISLSEDAAVSYWLGVRYYPIKVASGESLIRDVRWLHRLTPTV